jgi:hypothetical protein
MLAVDDVGRRIARELGGKVFAARLANVRQQAAFALISSTTRYLIMSHIAMVSVIFFKYVTADGSAEMERLLLLVEGLPSVVSFAILSLPDSHCWGKNLFNSTFLLLS